MDFNRNEICADSSDWIVRTLTTGLIIIELDILRESTNASAIVRFSHPPRVIEAANTSLVKRLEVLILMIVPLTLFFTDRPFTL